jgi:hypothetical protein
MTCIFFKQQQNRNKTKTMGRECGTYERGKQLHTGFWLTKKNEKESLEDLM